MDDLISRQASIDALDEIEAEVADGYGYQYAKWREYFVEMPSAQPEPHDLVSRRAALEAMDTWDKFGCDPDGKLVRYDDDKHYIPYVHYEDMVHVIKHLPSAQPVRHAHWIPDERDTGEGSNTYKCSACGEIQMVIEGTPKENGWKYCPNCGAKMDGEKESEHD